MTQIKWQRLPCHTQPSGREGALELTQASLERLGPVSRFNLSSEAYLTHFPLRMLTALWQLWRDGTAAALPVPTPISGGQT